MGTTTLASGLLAYVQTSFDGTTVYFAFGIPSGSDGQPVPEGPAGPTGPTGSPGEVTQAQLDSAIAGTASNTIAIATLDIRISDPPTQSEVQQVLAKLNELIVALRR